MAKDIIFGEDARKALQAGVDKIVMVTGYNAEALEHHLAASGIIFLRNENYMTTQMFDSVKIGLEYLKNNNSHRFLTPALESVIASKVKDSEDRIARMLFKLTVDVNLLAHVVADTYKFNLEALDKLRIESIQEVKTTNGTLTANDIFRRK